MKPEWAAVMIGAVVGGFTITGVLIALRTYVESTSDRKVSQARLVWAELAGHVPKAEDAMAGDMGKELLEDLLGPESRILDSHGDDYVAQVADGQPHSTMAREVIIFGVRITNNSEEPIGRCWLRLEGLKRMGASPPRDWRYGHRGQAARVIPPRTTMSFRLVVPQSYADLNMRTTRVVVYFTDSAGHRWRRTDTNTPTEVHKPRSTRWPVLRAWMDGNR